MENIWTRINDETPMYMSEICKEYKLVSIKLSPLKTALIATSYAIIIEVDRFEIDLIYVQKKGDDLLAYRCGNYLARRFDEKDRINLLEGTGADILVRNDIIITSNGLSNKCKDVLMGDLKWLDEYKKSSRFSQVKLSNEEIENINNYFS